MQHYIGVYSVCCSPRYFFLIQGHRTLKSYHTLLILTNSEDKDEVLHNAAPHHDPHSLRSTKATHFTEHGTHHGDPHYDKQSTTLLEILCRGSYICEAYICDLANSEDPDEMSHNATFQQGLHCLLRRSSENEIQFHVDCMHVTCCPSNYTMDQKKYIVSNLEERSISLLV